MAKGKTEGGIDLVASVMEGRAGLSAHVLMDLSLDAGFELEKVRAGSALDAKKLKGLASALRRVSSPNTKGAPLQFVEPGYFRPLGSLSTQITGEAASVRVIKEVMADAASRLTKFAKDQKDVAEARALIDFCAALHRVLRDEQKAESQSGDFDWRFLDAKATAGCVIK